MSAHYLPNNYANRSAKTTVRREAERLAAQWEKELCEGKYHAPTNTSWEAFRERFEDEKLSALSQNTAEATSTAFNHLERIINPEMLSALTPAVLSRFQAELRRTGIKETSIATHLRPLRAALSWAVSMRLLPVMPSITMPRKASGRKLMRGRPISHEEFDRMLAAVPLIRPRDAATWQHYLEGLWLSGLRLEESLIFSWDADTPIVVDLSGRRPRLRIYAEADKGGQDRLLPMMPDFAEFLLKTPSVDRQGPVFPIVGLITRQPITPKRVSRIVSAIGEQAGIIVNRMDEKYASAHDLRRSFGTRWASRVKPTSLQLLMRHESIETTLKYYVAQDTDEIAEDLWKEHSSAAKAAVAHSPEADAG